jgi:hypothetical protein
MTKKIPARKEGKNGRTQNKTVGGGVIVNAIKLIKPVNKNQ